MTIEKQVLLCSKELVRLGLKLVTAESCTGGWVAQEMTAIAGSSTWFERGIVSYSNDAKNQLLNVSINDIELHGAVSEVVVRAMAEGAVSQLKNCVSIAITGIAGPSGGSKEKPVGTVWIGCSDGNSTYAKPYLFSGDRRSIREQSVRASLRLLQESFLKK